MVAKITVPRTVQRALNYNEQKVSKGQATCLFASGLLQEAADMNFYEKLQGFVNRNALNQRAGTNSIHVSLNFDPREKIDPEKLIEIAVAYMTKIGFEEQPYLVYQHTDAGHPHIHIVASAIKPDGKRISLHNIGRNQSTIARKEIEQQFNLIKAEGRRQDTIHDVKPVQTGRLRYGKEEFKRSIDNVLRVVIDQYKYSSLAELNAVLKLYNVVADTGEEGSIIHRKGGLVYRALTAEGKKIGVPLKASVFFGSPTLKKLQQKFEENKSIKGPFIKPLRTTIDWILLKKPASLEAFRKSLDQEKISLVIRQNEEGVIYGLTYIDHRYHAVFNGSDIGKSYSAKGVTEKMAEYQLAQMKSPIAREYVIKTKQGLSNPGKTLSKSTDQNNILPELLGSNPSFQYLPAGLRKKKRKKRKPNS